MILDRDGVINQDREDYVLSPKALEPIPGSLDAIARLHRAGFQVAIATNQSVVGRGFISAKELETIHAKLVEQVKQAGGRITLIRYCPHLPKAGCNCRKPKPGLLFEIGKRLGASLLQVPFIGDSRRDLQAARAAGCKPVLVRTGKGVVTATNWGHLADDCFDNLAEAVEQLVKHPD